MPDRSGKIHVYGRLRRERRRRLFDARLQPRARVAAKSSRSNGLGVEMTLADVEADELIALLNAADGVRQTSFLNLLQSAARALTKPPG